ncbi:MAG TPA: phosphotransferase family protein [Kineosporiaceae bacterium]|nr:phosphotransferase family protein [Kineosporiaceae bacterium]
MSEPPAGHAGGAGPGEDPPGLDLARLEAWLDAELPGLRSGHLRGTVIAGGRSNLTYRLEDGGSVWALRRPPLGHVLPTAHDMAREFRVISGLRGSEVPVPVAVGLCEDPSVLGCPFYLMDFVDGVVLSRPRAVPADARHRVGELLVDTLVALHTVDPGAVGLGDLGRPDGFRTRQVERWHRQFAASWEGDHPVETEVVRRLRGGVPTDGPTGIVHGDYRLTNLMYRPDLSAVAAVVDWEMATLGDPLTDVALLHAYHSLASRAPGLLADFGPAQGYLGPDELVARYCAATGTPGEALDWYLTFAYFKISAIAAGIHARHRAGLTVGEGFEAFGSVVDLALDAALSHLPT